MSDRLPPLTALRAFEAAARNLSFAAAAAELGVTPAALSFQIKSLEERLGAPLFHRLNRAVALTEAGAALAPGATSGFETLSAAWRAARATRERNRLTVSAGPAFTSKWLAPRLGEFARAHPELELRLAATLALADLARDDVDLAIRFGRTPPEGAQSVLLMREAVTPLARPDVATRLRAPSDLLNETLIRDGSMPSLNEPLGWDVWLKAAGVAAEPPHGPIFNQADHAVDFALQGGGVVLGRVSMAIESLRNGALVAPFRPALPTQAAYRLLRRDGPPPRAAETAFSAWLKGQVARDAALAESIGFELL